MLPTGFGRGVALQHAQKNRLEHIFGIVGVGRNTVRRAKHHDVVLAEDLLQIGGAYFRRFHWGSHQRFHPIGLFHIEDGRHEAVVKRFKELGYLYVTLDLQGFRSGSANEILKWIGKK